MDMADEDAPGLFQLAQIGLFLLAVYVVGRAASRVYAQLVGEILAGMVLGPGLLDWVPYPNGVKLVGQVGLVLLVMEVGISVPLKALTTIWRPAMLIAVIGTIIPCVLGYATLTPLGHGGLEGLAAGTALSSSSIGMATKMLIQLNILNTPLGSLISVAAMVDDIVSLVILAVLDELAKGDSNTSAGSTAWLVLRPILISTAVICVGIVFIRTTPWLIRTLMGSWSEEVRDHGIQAALLCMTLGFTIASGYVGSTYLLGAFAAGMSFSNVPGTQELWAKHFPLTEWLVSIFFASIGFVVPVAEMFEPTSFGLGMLYTVPAILGKAITGPFAGNVPDALVVGAAMIGRGELGFVIAEQALGEGILTIRSFIACIWALLLATVLAPFLLRATLQYKLRRETNNSTDDIQLSDGGLVELSRDIDIPLSSRRSSTV